MKNISQDTTVRTYPKGIDYEAGKKTCSINLGQELLNNIFKKRFQYARASYANYLAKIQSEH